MSILQNKFAVHVVLEVVVIGVLFVYFNKKLAAVATTLDDINSKIQKQEQIIEKQTSQIRYLTKSLKTLSSKNVCSVEPKGGEKDSVGNKNPDEKEEDFDADTEAALNFERQRKKSAEKLLNRAAQNLNNLFGSVPLMSAFPMFNAFSPPDVASTAFVQEVGENDVSGNEYTDLDKEIEDELNELK